MSEKTDASTKQNTELPSTIETEPIATKNKVRVVTAASLFDGHDAAINVMRRIIQSTGAEVIHLAHNRSVREVVETAVQEDAQAIAVTCYQGGHMEYFTYMRELLDSLNAKHIKIFGGGGGVIVPRETKELKDKNIAITYHPDEGRKLGLQGMINDLMRKSDFSTIDVAGKPDISNITNKPESWSEIARAISHAEEDSQTQEISLTGKNDKRIPVVGITGMGGAGKSSLIDEIILRFTHDFPDKTVGLIAIDPSIQVTGGAMLGDRIRMNSTAMCDRTYMRSIATRESITEIPQVTFPAINILKNAGYDLIIVETPGIGQWHTQVTTVSDVSLYVMTQEFGAQLQLEKHNMLYIADLVVLNKFERRGSEDALRSVQKQVQRNRKEFAKDLTEMPVYPTIASTFNDAGVNNLYASMISLINDKTGVNWDSDVAKSRSTDYRQIKHIIPPDRTRYLAEIAETVRKYKKDADKQAALAAKYQEMHGAIEAMQTALDNGVNLPENASEESVKKTLEMLKELYGNKITKENLDLIAGWEAVKEKFSGETFKYQVRDKIFEQPLIKESLSHSKIPRVSVPEFKSWGEILKWRKLENVPGEFPYTAGVFPLKRDYEEPIRMFAGEGGPEKTNRRFHYLASGHGFARLSTAFDSVTLYGNDPDKRPDIWGKIGNSGVAISSLDDAKRLYSGFDLTDPATSVSMTVNGPAPIVLAFFFNTAIDQNVEKWLKANNKLAEARKYIEESWKAKGLTAPKYRLYPDDYSPEMPENNNGLGLEMLGCTGKELVEAGILPAEVYAEIKQKAISTVRGTVQADILKEDQAQNTCIFSTEFSLRMMGDIQQYFTNNKVRNFYSVSISGYHIAEAGANPITQLALTLANGLTYVEYYLHRGMKIDEFAPNLSFFFSNGMDPEYAVIGRVARRIWAVAMRELYNANSRSQKLKYHIQTSGRSLHAQEMSFNDIRTTLQGLLAIYDNCNSLHTNAYDEAITTPTEESVRRAVAIQLIINREFGVAKNENPNQGSFFMEMLTDLVEEAVLDLFVQIADRGGVLGAMETSYQRNRIQEESLYYEYLKHVGKYPLIGVNTFIDAETLEDGFEMPEPELRRSTEDEKHNQLQAVLDIHKRYEDSAPEGLAKLQKVALSGGNIFEELLETAKISTIGEITNALFKVGGQYRRNM